MPSKNEEPNNSAAHYTNAVPSSPGSRCTTAERKSGCRCTSPDCKTGFRYTTPGADSLIRNSVESFRCYPNPPTADDSRNRSARRSSSWLDDSCCRSLAVLVRNRSSCLAQSTSVWNSQAAQSWTSYKFLPGSPVVSRTVVGLPTVQTVGSFSSRVRAWHSIPSNGRQSSPRRELRRIPPSYSSCDRKSAMPLLLACCAPSRYDSPLLPTESPHAHRARSRRMRLLALASRVCRLSPARFADSTHLIAAPHD